MGYHGSAIHWSNDNPGEDGWEDEPLSSVRRRTVIYLWFNCHWLAREGGGFRTAADQSVSPHPHPRAPEIARVRMPVLARLVTGRNQTSTDLCLPSSSSMVPKSPGGNSHGSWAPRRRGKSFSAPFLCFSLVEWREGREREVVKGGKGGREVRMGKNRASVFPAHVAQV